MALTLAADVREVEARHDGHEDAVPFGEQPELRARLDAELPAMDGLGGVACAPGGEVVVEGEDGERVEGEAVVEEATGD